MLTTEDILIFFSTDGKSYYIIRTIRFGSVI